MNVSMIKLRGRGFLIGNLTLISLLLFTVISFAVCLNMIPETVLRLLSDMPEKKLSIVIILTCTAIIFLILVVFSSVEMGIERYFFRKAQRKGASAKDLFFYFRPRETVKLVKFKIRFSILKSAIFFVCFLPAFLCVLLIKTMLQTTASLTVSAVMIISLILFILNGSVFYSKIRSSLFLSKYFFLEGEYLNFKHLISSSQNQMKAHKKTLSKLKLSFAGWFLSCIFLIPVSYVFSYYSQSKAVAAVEFMSE